VKIVDRLPYADQPAASNVRGEAIRVKPFQILVQVSIGLRSLPDWDPRTPTFPAIMDTGNNHNLSIRRGQLLRWAGLNPEALTILGALRERGQRVALHAARLWLHRNKPGHSDLLGREPCPLRVEEGIAIYPDETGPRLPILGLRTLTQNELLCLLDGRRKRVTISTATSWWWPFG